MKKDWEELIKMTGNNPIEIERVRLTDQDIAIEGHFDLPPLAQLSMDEQVFVAAFIKCHGSIKQMEQIFDISYPTVKSRLNKIAEKMPFAQVTREADPMTVLEQVEAGVLSVNEALEKLQQ